MLYQKDTLLKSASVTLSIYAFRYKITAPDMQISKTIYCVPQISENYKFTPLQSILNRPKNKTFQALAPTLSIAPAVGRLCSAQIINADKNPHTHTQKTRKFTARFIGYISLRNKKYAPAANGKGHISKIRKIYFPHI